MLLKRSKRMPGVLIAVIGATVLVATLGLDNYGVSVLGSLPQGLPAFAIPWITPADVVPVLMGGFAVAIVSFADTSVLSRTYAEKTASHVDPNQEMVGLGAANLAAGFFQGFPISSSSSRTPVAEAAGARTQLTSVVGALAVALLLLLAPNLLQYLPNTALAAVVIAAAIGLFEFADLRRIYRIQRWEFWLSIAAASGSSCSAPFPALAWRSCWPSSSSSGMAGARTRPCSAASRASMATTTSSRYPDARLIPGLVLFRWAAPLFFANAEWFHERALDAVAASPTPVRWLVVTAEPVTSVDVTAADIVAKLDETLQAAGIELCFAEMKDPVQDKLKRFGLFNRLGAEVFFPTIGEAVNTYLRLYPEVAGLLKCH
jgi:MFS superfamily sulfate permease-like transporter